VGTYTNWTAVTDRPVESGLLLLDYDNAPSVGPRPERRLSIIDPLDSDLGICNRRGTAKMIYDTLKMRVRGTQRTIIDREIWSADPVAHRHTDFGANYKWNGRRVLVNLERELLAENLRLRL
jgi:hypothetical protein